VPQPRGLKLELINAPHHAFVDNEMLRANREHLFSVLRDIVYTHSSPLFIEAQRHPRPEDLTNTVFHILRNARVLQPGRQPDMVVCWGGHSISHEEYQYSKEVGHQLGLRELSICTGCGPGAMKGPMKGATIGHAKQRVKNGRYIGITEPGIIGAEAPNPIVNELVIMPDIEKRPGSFRTPWPRRGRIPRWCRHSGRNSLPVGYFIAPRQRRYSLPGGVYRQARER